MKLLSVELCGEKLLMHIGSIAAESAYLERYTETLLYKLTRLNRDVGRPIIEAPMLGGKLDLLLEVGKARLKNRQKKQAEFRQLISRIKNANADRATAVHGIWIPDISQGIIDSIRNPRPIASKRGKPGKPDVTLAADRAEKLAEEIYNGHVGLHAFARKAWPKLFPPTP